jgi:hypothetical protein
MQAIQNIAVINSRPSVWGDAALGIVRSHPHCVSVREWMDGSIKDLTAIAYCAVVRKGQQEEIRSFSIEQAKKASLWGKTGPWTQYPERMLQMRARGFAIRDTFPDALRGLHIAEEAQDIIDITPPMNTQKVELITKNIGVPLSQQHVTSVEVVDDFLAAIKDSYSIDTLKIIYNEAVKQMKDDKENRNLIYKEVQARKKQLTQVAETKVSESDHSEFLAQYDGVETK